MHSWDFVAPWRRQYRFPPDFHHALKISYSPYVFLYVLHIEGGKSTVTLASLPLVYHKWGECTFITKRTNQNIGALFFCFFKYTNIWMPKFIVVIFFCRCIAFIWDWFRCCNSVDLRVRLLTLWGPIRSLKTWLPMKLMLIRMDLSTKQCGLTHTLFTSSFNT